jgi:vacuolar protein sorting-associated protein 33B
LVFKQVLDQINEFEKSTTTSPEAKYHIVVFPTVPMASFTHLVEEEGLHHRLTLHKFQWDFIVLDTGVLSLEIPRLFTDLFVHPQVTTLLPSLAHTFRLFNMMFKRPNLILTLGSNAESILQMVHRIEDYKQTECRDESEDSADFNAMIVIDRDRDYHSALLTPCVYSGLLLELFNYNSGAITIDADKNKVHTERLDLVRQEKAPTDKKDISSLRMNEHVCQIFKVHRYRHFAEIPGLLASQAKALGIEGKSYKDMKIHEMKEYVSTKLPQVQLKKRELFKHLLLCEAIVNTLGNQFETLQVVEENMIACENKKQTMSYIEEQLNIDPHRFNTLRLICLAHITHGLTGDELSKFVGMFCNSFGHQYLHVFQNLYTAKLMPELSVTKGKMLPNLAIAKRQTQFQVDANKLKLIPVAVEEKEDPAASTSPIKLKKDPTCPSYVFNGNYIPLVAMLAQTVIKAGSFEDIATKLGHLDDLRVTGKAFDKNLRSVKDIQSRLKSGEFKDKFLPMRPRTLFVFIVGGVTYAEIAAINLVERFTASKIVIASNCVVSGGDLMEAAFSK